jgi:ATP-dependent RNA helicase DeaD
VQFHEFDLAEPILRALDELGYTEATPIQEGTIEHLLHDRDVVGQAQTGTGKTAAFMLPILDRIDPDAKDVQAIVLCPTRELALQVADAARSFSKYQEGVDVVPVYGGAPIRDQIDRLSRGAQVVVGTPGRVLDLLNRGKLLLMDARMVVLDEADEMLSMGFIDDVRAILRRTPYGRQTALFSATLPPEIRRLAEEELHSPRTVSVTPEVVTVEKIEQRMIEVAPNDKAETLDRILRAEKPKCALIFARTKLGCQRLADDLERRGHRVRALHGDMTQGARDSVMIAFRASRVAILVATDVASRGLDVSHLSHVINYDLPDDAEVYVHRIGRTGRVGRDGKAISIVTRRERPKLDAILALTGAAIGQWTPPGAPPAAEPASPAVADAVPEEVVATAPAVSSDGVEAVDGEGAPRRKRRGRRGGRRRSGGAERAADGAVEPVAAPQES